MARGLQRTRQTKFVCFKCKGEGHVKKDCPSNQSSEKKAINFNCDSRRDRNSRREKHTSLRVHGATIAVIQIQEADLKMRNMKPCVLWHNKRTRNENPLLLLMKL